MKSEPTRILLIEDEPVYSGLLQKCLARADASLHVESTQNLASGIEMIRQATFDVVVLDLNLPDTSGTGTVSRMHAAAPELPIVVISGSDDKTTIYEVLHTGAQEFLAKTADAPILLARTIDHAIERKRVDLALKQTTERWRTLFDHNPIETIVVDGEGRITDVNAAKRDSGNRPPALNDRMYVDYAANHKTDMRAELTACIETRESKEFPDQAYRDKTLTINISPFPGEDSRGAIITSQDITERKRAQTDFENVFELSQDMICVATPRGGFVQVSPSCEAILGYTVSEMLDLDWTELIHPDDRAPTQAKVEAQLQGKDTVDFVNRYRCKDGSYKSLEWNATFAKNGNVYGAARDISSRLQDEENRLALEAQLRQSQKLESIGTLAGGVAHEINNPINGIMNYAQLILDKLGPDSPVSGFAEQIEKETHRVAAIVKSLLSFSHPSKENHRPARICDIVEDTLSLTGGFLRNRITLKVDIPEDLPMIQCQSQQIQQVIMNLLTNARDALNEKYSGNDDNKRIIISASTIAESAEDRTEGAPIETRMIRITVEDHGAGIPKKAQEHLFDPFFTSKRPGKGTGLGLSISYTIVKEHGGELSAESEIGEWTRFHMDLPIAGAGTQSEKNGNDE